MCLSFSGTGPALRHRSMQTSMFQHNLANLMPMQGLSFDQALTSQRNERNLIQSQSLSSLDRLTLARSRENSALLEQSVKVRSFRHQRRQVRARSALSGGLLHSKSLNPNIGFTRVLGFMLKPENHYLFHRFGRSRFMSLRNRQRYKVQAFSDLWRACRWMLAWLQPQQIRELIMILRIYSRFSC